MKHYDEIGFTLLFILFSSTFLLSQNLRLSDMTFSHDLDNVQNITTSNWTSENIAFAIIYGLEFENGDKLICGNYNDCLLYTSPSPRDGLLSRMPSSA